MLIVGLGNPGNSYALNRHNVGFQAVDWIAKAYNAPAFKANKSLHGLITQVQIIGQKFLLLKPQEYMNLSGRSVQAALAYYQITPSNLLVIHDELDLPFLSLRVKQGGGAGGHNGLRSLDGLIGKDYWRLRVGIAHPGDKALVTTYVLQNFDSQEMNDLPKFFEYLTTHLGLFQKELAQKSAFQAKMGAFRLNPPPPPLEGKVQNGI